MGFIKIGGAALNQTPIDWENNTNNIISAIELARQKGIQILCLPELCITGYGCEDLFLAPWIMETALDQLKSLLPHCKNIAVCVGLPISFEGKIFNCTAFIENAELKGIYAKQFLAREGVHYEPRWFNSWPKNLISTFKSSEIEAPIGEVTFQIGQVNIGFEICEDAWVNDNDRPACRHIKKGVNLIMNPSASHFAFGKSDFRYNLISSSSKTFNCTYIYANLLGNEAGRMIYDGEVLIYKNGELLQRNDRLSFHNINLVSADINFTTGETKQEVLTEDHRDREYEFWEATTLGLFDYMRKSRSKGFVLSLSGGADSSACAVIVNEMVKKGIKELGFDVFISKAGFSDVFSPSQKHNSFEEQVKLVMNKILITAYQGTKNSGPETFTSASELAESLGATFHYWMVDEEVNAYIKTTENAIGRKLEWKTDDITLQNIQARSRAPIIWMLANIHHALLITTSNRSEGDVGYATMDGDTAGSIAPIAGVDKYFISNWLIWAEKNLDQPGLKYVNNLTPTAELRPSDRSQTDEKDLMPYYILVEIERQAIRDRKSPLLVFEELNKKNLEESELLKTHIIKFFRMWCRNQWKRERIAPSFHLDEFNVDPRSWYRFPILSGGYEKELKQLIDTSEYE